MNDNELVVERETMVSLYGPKYLLSIMYGPWGIYYARYISESFHK